MKTAFLIAAFILCTQPLFAQGQSPTCNPFPKTISVSGSAELEIVPDELYVRVDLKEYKKKGEGKKEIEQIRTDFLAACRQAGIPDSNISVLNFTGNNANLILRKRTNKDPDLMATLSYQVKFTKAAKMDELINKLDDEATGSFTVINTSHSKATELRKQLKIEAVKAAKAKALYLCEAVNEQLGAAIIIEEPAEYANNGLTRSNELSQRRVGYNSLAISDTDASEIDFRKIKYRFEVKMVFAIK